MNEEYFRHRNDAKDSIYNYPEDDFQRTTFYTQTHDDVTPEKVSILETTKAQNHTTFYGQNDTKKKQEPVGSGNIANVHNVQIKKDEKKKDIGEVGIEPNVHAFASDEVSPLKHIRRDEKPDLNGTADNAFPASFSQKVKKDIGEVGMEPNVHAFASDEVSPLKHIRRDEKPDLNGTADNAFPASFHQKNKKDIGEKGIEPNVHEFASDEVSPLVHIRRDEQFSTNGSGAGGWGDGSSFVQKQLKKNVNDVKNADIRPDVWKISSDCTDGVALWRPENPPATNYEPYSPPAEKAAVSLSQEPEEGTKDKEGDPTTGAVEKVSVLDPITH